MDRDYRIHTTVIFVISIVLSVIGMIVEMEWGKAVFPQNVKSELLRNIILVLTGLCICGIIFGISKAIGCHKTLWYLTVLMFLLMGLCRTSLAQTETGVRLLHIGPVVLRFVVIVPLVYIVIISYVVDLFGKEEEYKMFLVVLAITVGFLIVSQWFDLADRLWYLFPVIAYCLMFPYMKNHIWYYFLPGIFVVIYAARIMYVWFQPETNIIRYFDKIIAEWLHPNSKIYSDTNSFLHLQREMARSGGFFGNKEGFLFDKISYQNSSDILLIGLLQRFGILGFIVSLILFLEMCRRIFLISAKRIKQGYYYQGMICKGIGVYLFFCGVCSIISQLYILPMSSMFDFPFLCIGGFQPIQYLYLSVVLLSIGSKEKNME